MNLFDMISAVNPFLTLMLGTFVFYKEKKRQQLAAAENAEADTITRYGREWQELYEKKEKKVEQLDGKIDELYVELNKQRDKIWALKDEKAQLELENIKLEYHRCYVKHCAKRQPPRDTEEKGGGND